MLESCFDIIHDFVRLLDHFCTLNSQSFQWQMNRTSFRDAILHFWESHEQKWSRRHIKSWITSKQLSSISTTKGGCCRTQIRRYAQKYMRTHRWPPGLVSIIIDENRCHCKNSNFHFSALSFNTTQLNKARKLQNKRPEILFPDLMKFLSLQSGKMVKIKDQRSG